MSNTKRISEPEKNKEVQNIEVEKENNKKVVDTPVATDEEKKQIIGVVTDCVKLNVRKKPKIGAEIITEIILNAKVQIDESESTKDWFKVCTETGIEGFCMKKFVAVNK